MHHPAWEDTMMDQRHHPQELESYERWILRVCEDLNRLLQLDVDAACTYREAISHVDDDQVRRDLQAFLADHERHVMELTTIIRELGGTPIEPARDLKGAILEGMTRLRSRGTLGALRAMRLNEKLTNRAYDKAAYRHVPPLAAAVIIENSNDERRHLAAIEAHIERLTDRHVYEVGEVDRKATEGDGERTFPVM
jgi:rubrerythrin